ncbi:unnamed protein product [Diamesa hyperborea]
MLKLFLFYLLTSSLSDAANILGVWPVASRADYSLGLALFNELAANGHNITFMSPYGQSDGHDNIKFIKLDGAVEAANSIEFETNENSLTSILMHQMEVGAEIGNFTLNHPKIQEVLLSNEKFDLFIMDDLMNDCLLGIANYLQVPVIKFRSSNDIPTGDDSNIEMFTTQHGFYNRVRKSFFKVLEIFQYDYQYIPQQEAIYKSYFNKIAPQSAEPALKELINDVSLVLVNSHPLMQESRVYLPANVIEIGGLHLKQLTDDVEPHLFRLMDKAKDVIYFSLGGYIKSADLNPDILDVILKVFASMESTLILWKFESIKLKDRHPKNVIIGPWMPQQEILAHKNLKVFITHGGFLSTMEAINYGKPIVGIPFTNVQKLNMKRAVNQGYGIYVDIFTMTELSLQTAINAALNDNTYQSNATELSKRFQDILVKPIDKAVYYVEHQIRKLVIVVNTYAIDDCEPI